MLKKKKEERSRISHGAQTTKRVHSQQNVDKVQPGPYFIGTDFKQRYIRLTHKQPGYHAGLYFMYNHMNTHDL